MCDGRGRVDLARVEAASAQARVRCCGRRSGRLLAEAAASASRRKICGPGSGICRHAEGALGACPERPGPLMSAVNRWSRQIGEAVPGAPQATPQPAPRIVFARPRLNGQRDGSCCSATRAVRGDTTRSAAAVGSGGAPRRARCDCDQSQTRARGGRDWPGGPAHAGTSRGLLRAWLCLWPSHHPPSGQSLHQPSLLLQLSSPPRPRHAQPHVRQNHALRPASALTLLLSPSALNPRPHRPGLSLTLAFSSVCRSLLFSP